MACDTQVIHIAQDGTVDTETCELSKQAKHRILWVSKSDQPYDIHFDGNRSPFTKTQQTHMLTVEPRGWVESGEIYSGAEQGQDKVYKYHTAKAGTKEVAADPGVIVNG